MKCFSGTSDIFRGSSFSVLFVIMLWYPSPKKSLVLLLLLLACSTRGCVQKGSNEACAAI